MELLDREGQTQSELLATVGLDHSTVSKSLGRMERAGLLTRTAAEHDRRQLIVSLTDKGRAMRGPLEDMWSELERTSVRDLDPDTIGQFIATSGRIRRAIAAREGTAFKGEADPDLSTAGNPNPSEES